MTGHASKVGRKNSAKSDDKLVIAFLLSFRGRNRDQHIHHSGAGNRQVNSANSHREIVNGWYPYTNPGRYEMTGHASKVGRKNSAKSDDKLVIALLQQPSLDKAAAVAGISSATAWRRTQDPGFQDQLRKARRDAFSQSVGRLQQAGPAAVSTLLRVMADPGAAAASRVRAASQVLEISVRAMELDDLEARIARLEQEQEKSSK